MKKVVKIIILLIVIALLALLGVKAIKNKRAKEASTPVAKIYPIIAKTMVPVSSRTILTLPYLAEIVNEKDVTLSSRLASRIEMIVSSGKSVKKGEVVARLDTTDLHANIDAAKVSLNTLLKSHKRTRALYRVKGASIEQLQKEESQIAALRAKLASLENQLSYATITAPVDGVVAKAYAAEGDVSMPGKPLLQISAQQGFSLLVRTPQDIAPVSVIFESKTYPLHALNATFHGLKEYKASVPGMQGLTAGERVEVSVVIFDDMGVKLPFDALLNRNGKSYILVVQGKQAVVKEVHIVQSGEEGVVVSGVPKGVKIVIAKPDILFKLVSGYPLKTEE